MIKLIATGICLWLATASANLAAQGNAYLLPSDSGYEAGKAHVVEIAKASLKDPESARIGSVIICGWLPDTKLALVNVNAKNSYGAYTGYKIGSVVDSHGVQGVIFINPNPSTPAEYRDQKALLNALDACDPALTAYKAGGFEK